MPSRDAMRGREPLAAWLGAEIARAAAGRELEAAALWPSLGAVVPGLVAALHVPNLARSYDRPALAWHIALLRSATRRREPVGTRRRAPATAPRERDGRRRPSR